MPAKKKKFSEMYTAKKDYSSGRVRFKVADAWKALSEIAGESPELLFKAMFLHCKGTIPLRAELTKSGTDPKFWKQPRVWSLFLGILDFETSKVKLFLLL